MNGLVATHDRDTHAVLRRACLICILGAMPAAADKPIAGPVAPPPRFDGADYWAKSGAVRTAPPPYAHADALPADWIRALLAAGLLGAASQAGRDAVDDTPAD